MEVVLRFREEISTDWIPGQAIPLYRIVADPSRTPGLPGMTQSKAWCGLFLACQLPHPALTVSAGTTQAAYMSNSVVTVTEMDLERVLVL
jgi:hypothetical protein